MVAVADAGRPEQDDDDPLAVLDLLNPQHDADSEACLKHFETQL